jgi:hypothetical protein
LPTSRARGKTSETELQIIQLDQDFRTEVLKDLRDAQGKIAELKERITAAEDSSSASICGRRNRASFTSFPCIPSAA